MSVLLNPAQERAAHHLSGPALVLAGAGSGKTRVIVERIAWIVSEQGVDPRQILALTFTNKAAKEMRSRVAERLGVETVGAWLGTFHSFGLSVLRRHIDRFERSRSFTVFDDADQLSLMKSLIKELPQGESAVSPREALSWCSRLKQDLGAPDFETEPESFEEGIYRRLWKRYHDSLTRANAVDFDDLLVLTARLLIEFEDVRTQYQNRYRHILIDEYQDTNIAQFRIAARLSEVHGNLFVVGDEDQGIYSWRGANIRNVLEFEHEFTPNTIYRLEQNYRSTKPILDAANTLVAKNIQRLGKKLWTSRTDGEPVRLYLAADGDEEAAWVVDDLVRKQLSPSQVAVIFRTNAQSRLLEEAFRRRGIAYTLVGGVQFYGRKEVKDLLAYLRLVVNPRDDVSARRVLNVPARGIGSTSMDRIEEYATQRGQPLTQILREIEFDQTLPSRARESAMEFIHVIDDLALVAKGGKVKPVLVQLEERIGYREFVKKTDEKDATSRVEIVDEFVSACAQFDEREGGDLATYLQELALVSDVDTWDDSKPAATLITCHSAKGLEFDYVYLVGLEEGLLPHASASDTDAELEEERRLCYVAMTRARQGLVLSAAESRMLYGERTARRPSRFLREIGLERTKPERREGAVPPSEVRTRTISRSGESTTLKMGSRVWHAQFGKGIVMYTSGTGSKQRARIKFNTGRSRDFMVSAAPLKVLDGDDK